MAWNGSAGKVEQPSTQNAKSRHIPLVIVISGVVILGVIGAVVFWPVAQTEAPKSEKKLVQNVAKSRCSPVESVRRALPKNLSGKSNKKRPMRNVELFAHLTGSDRKLAESVQEALDNDDFRKMMTVASEALMSTNVEVRLNVVDALGWFGVQALPELTGAMADANEDVRQAAANHFELALQEVEKPQEQFDIAMAAFATLSDADQLASLGGILNNAATELIDGEDDAEKAADNRLKVVQALVDIITGETLPQNIAAAKEAYNDITGYEWHGIDQAEAYLQNPEGYEEPED